MIFFDKLIDFVFDERKKISSKAAIITLSLLGILLVDNLVGFSYNYKISNKIEQIQKLNLIISDTKADDATKGSMLKLRDEVVNRKNIIEIFSEYISSFSSNKTIINKSRNDNVKVNVIESRNSAFHLTSSILFYFLAIIMIPMMFFLDRTSSFSQRIAMGLILSLMFAGIGIFLFWLCSLIPKIWDGSWIINYIINILIQGSFIYLLFKFAPKATNH
ncbi:hypothetical protein BSF41_25110 [Flavobacterium sp. ACN2]|jgi:hypothetical protein|uniref:hypothetical protein n=1 Tax=Flavobacterium sp. ACN2 TaxID=1975676 RepID=UPI000BB3D809|nr:hypothetical protein [Flavobacterium sp. ACN2]PBI88383.1 hypothetical protein BSF41_25110 [Flavobacterium sp. ACN2]